MNIKKILKIIIATLFLTTLLNGANVEIKKQKYIKATDMYVNIPNDFYLAYDAKIYEMLEGKKGKDLKEYYEKRIDKCEYSNNIINCNTDKNFFLIFKNHKKDIIILEMVNNNRVDVEVKKEILKERYKKDINAKNIKLMLSVSDQYYTINLALYDKISEKELYSKFTNIKDENYTYFSKMFWFLINHQNIDVKRGGYYKKLKVMAGIYKKYKKAQEELKFYKNYFPTAYISTIGQKQLIYYKYNPVITDKGIEKKLKYLEKQIKNNKTLTKKKLIKKNKEYEATKAKENILKKTIEKLKIDNKSLTESINQLRLKIKNNEDVSNKDVSNYINEISKLKRNERKFKSKYDIWKIKKSNLESKILKLESNIKKLESNIKIKEKELISTPKTVKTDTKIKTKIIKKTINNNMKNKIIIEKTLDELF